MWFVSWICPLQVCSIWRWKLQMWQHLGPVLWAMATPSSPWSNAGKPVGLAIQRYRWCEIIKLGWWHCLTGNWKIHVWYEHGGMFTDSVFHNCSDAWCYFSKQPVRFAQHNVDGLSRRTAHGIGKVWKCSGPLRATNWLAQASVVPSSQVVSSARVCFGRLGNTPPLSMDPWGVCLWLKLQVETRAASVRTVRTGQPSFFVIVQV